MYSRNWCCKGEPLNFATSGFTKHPRRTRPCGGGIQGFGLSRAWAAQEARSVMFLGTFIGLPPVDPACMLKPERCLGAWAVGLKPWFTWCSFCSYTASYPMTLFEWFEGRYITLREIMIHANTSLPCSHSHLHVLRRTPRKRYPTYQTPCTPSKVSPK